MGRSETARGRDNEAMGGSGSGSSKEGKTVHLDPVRFVLSITTPIVRANTVPVWHKLKLKGGGGGPNKIPNMGGPNLKL